MKITKYGHCCLLIEIDGVRLLTDPGTYTTAQNKVKGIDAVVISHEHADHFHIESLKEVIKNNPKAEIITNSAVGKLLDKEGIAYTKVGDKEKTSVKGIEISGHGIKHALIYKEFGQVENTGYFFNKKLFYPGDAFYDPKTPVDILALPTAGPWVKISDAIDYALAVRPRIAFPVHDAGLKNASFSSMILEKIFTPEKITFVQLELEKETEL